MFGQFNAALDATNENILDNSGFEMWEPTVIPHPQRPNDSVWWDKDIWENDLKAQPWIYQIYQGTQAMIQYYRAYRDAEEKHEGQYSVRVEKSEGAAK